MAENNISGGYIMLARNYKYTSIYRKKPLYYRCVWEHLLLTVNYADNKPLENFKRGEGLFCFNSCREYLYEVSQDQFNRAFAYLRDENMIECRRRGASIHVTILNYERYQDPNNYLGERKTKKAKQGILPILPPPVPDAPKTSWLTPYNEVWRKYLGADMDYKKECRSLSPIHDAYPVEQIIKHLTNYFEFHKQEGTLRMISMSRFVTTFEAWSGEQHVSPGQKTQKQFPDYKNPQDILLGGLK